MTGEKKVILHLIFDGVLFDQVYPLFEKMDHYENRYLFGSLNVAEDIKYIKNTEKLIRVDSLEKWGQIVSDPQLDIIYMHGLWPDYLKIIDYVRDNVIIMWWCYGMEIYENCFGLPPLMGLNIYKPRTYKFLESFGGFRRRMNLNLLFRHPQIYLLLSKIWNFIHQRKNSILKEVLARIDYAFTPLEIELLELKKRHSYIKAKPFVLRGLIPNEPLLIHYSIGNILLEHSANISDNHLDIIAALREKEINLYGRDIYIPLGYGVKDLAEKVQEEAHFDGANVHCLMDTLPFDDYAKMMDSCTHAIFGMIRQSGLGNIFLCFKKGIKVFFFKDSMLYKQFKADGYHVFSIEEDLNDDSIKEPLSENQALDNYNFFNTQWCDLGTFQEQMDKLLKN